MPFILKTGDITRQKTQAIVNAANSALRQGGGVCGAIFKAAGEEKLRETCEKIGSCPTGRAVITPGFDLDAEYIIHTPGPVWEGGGKNEENLLYLSYQNSLALAHEYGVKSISFPLISSGIYGYPPREALQVARRAIVDSPFGQDMDIYLVLHDRSWVILPDERQRDIIGYLEEKSTRPPRYEGALRTGEPKEGLGDAAPRQRRLKSTRPAKRESNADFAEDCCCFMREEPSPAPPNITPTAKKTGKKTTLREILSSAEETFSQMLLRIIDEKGYTDSEVYKKANVDRRLFSKIRTNPDYSPSKSTVISFAIALELDGEMTGELLAKAGYALSPSAKADLIVSFFIERGNYDIFELNETLFAFDCNPL